MKAVTCPLKLHLILLISLLPFYCDGAQSKSCGHKVNHSASFLPPVFKIGECRFNLTFTWKSGSYYFGSDWPVTSPLCFSDQLSRERRNGCWPKALNCYHTVHWTKDLWSSSTLSHHPFTLSAGQLIWNAQYKWLAALVVYQCPTMKDASRML